MRKGFTLIELLVVIAIIGVLSGIVLASLGTARGKGKDAAIQGALGSIRSQAVLYSSDNGNYGAVTNNDCAEAGSIFVLDASILNAVASVTSNGGVIACYAVNDTDDGSTSSGALATSYAVDSTLPSDDTGATHWCVDSENFAGSGKVATVSGDGTLTPYVASCQ